MPPFRYWHARRQPSGAARGISFTRLFTLEGGKRDEYIQVHDAHDELFVIL